jgi:hypothetical protein
MLITASLCVPYIFTFMESIAHSLFRNRKGPSVFDIITIFIIEGIHTFGLCLLVFRVLPSCDVIRALLLMNCVCIVPGICKMIFARNNAGPVGKVIIIFIDFIALVSQVSVFFVVMGTQYTAFIEKANYVPPAPTVDTKSSIDGSDPFSVAESSRLYGDNPNSSEKPTWKGSWEMPFSILFTSIIWWENYVDRDIRLGFIKLPFATYKRHLQSVRSKANIGASLWKIALTITFSVVMLPSKKFDNAFVRFPPSIDDIAPAPGIVPNSGREDFNGFDNMGNMDGDVFAAHKFFKRDVTKPLTNTLSTIISENLMTVPNNVWNPVTTPNLFDFIAVKVSIIIKIV